MISPENVRWNIFIRAIIDRNVVLYVPRFTPETGQSLQLARLWFGRRA